MEPEFRPEKQVTTLLFLELDKINLLHVFPQGAQEFLLYSRALDYVHLIKGHNLLQCINLFSQRSQMDGAYTISSAIVTSTFFAI